MNRFLSWLRDLLIVNFWWKLLALAIAVGIWAAVHNEPELSTFPVATVEYRNLPDDLEFSEEPVSSVKLELRGPQGELSGLGAGAAGTHPQVILDLATVTPGHRTFAISDANVKLPRGVRFEGSIPAEVRLQFDKRLIRTVPVEVHISGDNQNGYHVVEQIAEPKFLTIAGPAGHVNGVVAAVTDRIDVSSQVGFVKYRVNAFVQDPFVRFISPPQVTVSITVRR